MLPKVFALLFVLVWGTSLQAQTPFYQGKTIRLVAGTPAGSVYDLYARLVAQFLPKYIPGNPNIIVQNMPGVASMVAANYIYGVAKPDGLTIGSIQPALYFDQLVGRKEVQFEWQKFTWIGNTTVSHHLLYMRSDTPYKTIEDIRKASVPPKCGAEGTASSAYYLPKLLEETIGTKFTIITGYNSGSDVDLAVERGEVQCRAFTIAAFFAREPFHTWRKKGFVRVIIQTGKKRDGNLPDVPTLPELMVWVLIISNVIVCGLCFLILNHLAALTFIRGSLLIPFLLFLVFIGSFTANNDLYDIVVTLIFGVTGYFMVKWGWPRPPLVLGLTLGKIAENYLWISTAAYGAKWLMFPSVVILIAITLFTIAYPTIKERMGKAKYERPEDAM